MSIFAGDKKIADSTNLDPRSEIPNRGKNFGFVSFNEGFSGHLVEFCKQHFVSLPLRNVEPYLHLQLLLQGCILLYFHGPGKSKVKVKKCAGISQLGRELILGLMSLFPPL